MLRILFAGSGVASTPQYPIDSTEDTRFDEVIQNVKDLIGGLGDRSTTEAVVVAISSTSRPSIVSIETSSPSPSLSPVSNQSDEIDEILSRNSEIPGEKADTGPGSQSSLNKHTGPGSQSRVPGPESLPGPRGIWTGLLTHSELSPHLQFSSHHLSSSRVHSKLHTREPEKLICVRRAQFFMTMASLRLLMPCLCVLSNLNLTFPHVPSPENKKTVGR